MTKEIEGEVNTGAEKGYRDAFVRKDFIADKKIKITQPKHTNIFVKKYNLNQADASVIALAKEKNLILATEDEQQRKIAQAENIKVTNTCALLYYAYKRNKLEVKNALNLLDLLEKWGYRKETIIKTKEKILLEER